MFQITKVFETIVEHVSDEAEAMRVRISAATSPERGDTAQRGARTLAPNLIIIAPRPVASAW